MALKSIIDLEVDPKGNFKAFTEVWDKYQKALAQSPAEWAKVTAKIGGMRKEFDQLVKQQVASNAQARLMAEVERAAELTAKSMGDRWREIARTTKLVALDFKSMATTMKDATISLVKWGSVTSVVSGLLGAGSLFGLDRLAGAVGGRRSTALGLGASYGGTQAFGVNFGRLIEPNSFMSSVAEAKFDVQKRVGLLGAGLTEGDINAPTEQTSVALLDKLKQIADNTNPAMYGQVIQARQLGQFVSPQDLERLHNTSSAEYGQLRQGFVKDVGGFGIQDQITRKWQDFSTQMSHAGQSIENVFVTQLSGLVPGLTKLSSAFEDVVGKLLGSKGFKELIDEVSEGLGNFATYVGKPEFKKDIESFASGLSVIVKSIGEAIKWFSSNGLVNERSEEYGEWNTAVRGAKRMKEQHGNTWSYLFDTPSEQKNRSTVPGRMSQQELVDYIKKAAIARKIDPNIALTVAQHEGLGSFYGDQGTSFGAFQLHTTPGGQGHAVGDEFKKYTGLDPSDPRNEKATIDYGLDWVRKHGWGDWMGAKAAGVYGYAGVQNTNVNVWNNTGGSAVVTSGAASGAAAAAPSSVN